jgi:dihydrofolate reductase
MSLKLIMSVSHDGFVARGDSDDMAWTGRADKQLFKSLTLVGGALGVGSKTAAVMPTHLPGRTLHVLSNSPLFGMTLGSFAYRYPGAWLLGGQTIAMEALRLQMVDEVHLIRNPVELGAGIRDEVTPFLKTPLRWVQAHAVVHATDVWHEVWHRVV